MAFTTVVDKSTGDVFSEVMWDTYLRDNLNWLYGVFAGQTVIDHALPLAVNSHTVTANAPTFDAQQTWNSGGVAFAGIKLRVTDTASAAASLLIDLQVAGSTKFNVTKTGSIVGIGTAHNFGSGTAVAGHAVSATLAGTDDTAHKVLGLGAGGNTGYASFQRWTTTAVTTAKQIASIDTRAALVIVSGTDGTNYFCDLVLAGYDGFSTAISSQTEAGGPAARTYSNPGAGVLKVAMASGSYRLSTLAIQVQER